MRLSLAFATLAFSTLMFSTFMISDASAYCAAFVCKHPICQYQIMSSSGPRMVRLRGGERRVLSGLAGDAEYCDWQGGCVTPRRPVRSLGGC